jgi:hypothetical protein
MSDIVFFALIGIIVLAAAVWLLRPSANFPIAEFTPGATESVEGHADAATAGHCRFFPQLRQTLSEDDDRYLQGKASAAALREWRAARRVVMRKFLAGLHDDFARLDRTARAAARLAPHLDHLREAELFWLGLRFRLAYRLAILELSMGYRPTRQVMRLAEMVGGLGTTLGRMTAAIAENSGSSALTS